MTNSSHRPALYLLALAVALRALYWLQAADYPLLHVALLDEAYYLDQAGEILGGRWTLESGFFMDPLYAWIMAGVLALGDGANPTPMRLFQLLLDSANVILLWAIGRSLWSSRAGIVAGALYAVYPVAWFYSLTLLKTTITTSAMLAFIGLLVFGLRNRRGGGFWLAMGVGAGVLTYLRGNLLLLAPLTLIVLALRVRPWRSIVGHSASLTIGLALVLIPVALGHKAITGQLTPLPATAGSTLYSANHPGNPFGIYASPSFVRLNRPDLLETRYRQEAQRRLGREITAAESSTYWRNQAVAHWASAPEVLPRLVWYKTNQLITYRELPSNHSFRITATYAPMLVPVLPFFTLVLAAGVPGLIVGIRRNPAAIAVLVPIAVVVATSLIFYTASRFRLPMVPALLLGVGALAATDWYRHVRERAIVIAGVVLLALASLLAWSPRVEDANHWINVALAHARLGELEQSARILTRIETATQGNPRYWETRTFAALASNDHAAAMQFGKRGLAIEPNNPRLLFNTGVSALKLGHPDLAAELLSRASQLNPDQDTLRFLTEAKRQLRSLGVD